jgi:hypothetical protein
VVEIPHQELVWAKAPEVEYGEGITSREAFYKKEAEQAAPFIDNYSGAGFPQDWLIRIDEAGPITHYPLHYPAYEP